MSLAEQQSISLSNSKYIWEDIDNRAEQLGLNRSKYTQKLYEIDMKYNILSDNHKLDVLKKKYDVRKIDIVIIILLLAMFMFFLSFLWGFKWV